MAAAGRSEARAEVRKEAVRAAAREGVTSGIMPVAATTAKAAKAVERARAVTAAVLRIHLCKEYSYGK